MDISYILTVIGVILVSMMLHELMHGYIALKLGDDTARLLGRLSFNPLKHVDPIMTIGLPLLIVIANAMTGASTPVFGGAKPVPFNPANIRHGEWGVALVAVSGPLVNLLLAFISFAILAIFNIPSGAVLGNILTVSVWVNLGFFAFNILPIPPLDGSRFMYALAPEFVRRGMDIIESYGVFFVFLVVVLLNDMLARYMVGVIGGVIEAFSRVLFGIT